MNAPKITSHPLYRLLRDEKIEEFNERIAAGETEDLTGCDFRGLDLRTLNPAGLDLTDCYFRSCDLRGLDFRETKLEGASFASAQVSGCYFPKELTTQEVLASIQHGMRVRYYTHCSHCCK